MIFRVNENKKISIYDYYVTNACVLQFINVEDEDVIKDFFKGLEVESFDILDAELKEGKRLRYKGLLYKVKDGQTHQKQSDWNPKDAATLFEVIEPDHLGTKEDPIPAHTNMEYFKDKYYIENGVIYLCNSELAANGVVLQYTPSQLVDIYFIKVEE